MLKQAPRLEDVSYRHLTLCPPESNSVVMFDRKELNELNKKEELRELRQFPSVP
jgi:hypothetical protein